MNEKSKLYKILDTIFQFMFKKHFWSFRGMMSRLMCPENDPTHYSIEYLCKCKNYCEEHCRDEVTGCSVCEALKLNYSEFPKYVLEIYLSRIQNGFPFTDEQLLQEEQFYKMNKNKYLA